LIQAQWLGSQPYRWAHRLQRLRRQAVIAGLAPEVLWTMEHPPTLTTGRRAVPDLRPDLWKARGVDVVATERGGLATWHGPGQLVGYLIVNVGRRGVGVWDTVCAVELGLISWLEGQGIAAARDREHRGVWVGGSKIAAIGMHFRKGVSMHGFSLNVCNDLSAFSKFTPCGIPDASVTSMRVCGVDTTPFRVAPPVGRAVLGSLCDASNSGRQRR